MNETNSERSFHAACALRVHPFGAGWTKHPTKEAISSLIVSVRHLCQDLKLDFKEIVDDSFVAFHTQREFELDVVKEGFIVFETPVGGRVLARNNGEHFVDCVSVDGQNLPSSMDDPIVVRTMTKDGVTVGQDRFESFTIYLDEQRKEKEILDEFEILDDVKWIKKIIGGNGNLTVSTMIDTPLLTQ